MSQSITEGRQSKSLCIGNHAYIAVYGEFRTGKTQLAHTMSVVTQLPPDLGGASGKVWFIIVYSFLPPDRILISIGGLY